MVFRLAVLATLAILGAAGFVGSAQANGPTEPVRLPFLGGQAIKIIQGYHGGTHQGVERFSVDLVLAQGNSSHVPILAPVSGKIDWAYAPGVGNGCLAIQMPDANGLTVMICHVIFDRAFQRGESVAQGQRLGYLGPPGTVGNNGIPHAHVQLHRRDWGGRVPLPFAVPDGLPLDGANLPPKTGYNQYGGHGPIVSTNHPSGLPNGAAPASGQSASRAPAAAATAVPAPAFAAVSAPVAAPAPVSQPAPAPRAEAPAAETPAPPPPSPTAAAVAPAPTAVPPAAPAAPRVETPAAAEANAAVQVRQTCLNVRERPSLQAPTIRCLPDGARVTIVEGPVEAEGRQWYRLEGLGWVASDFLKKDEPAPPPTPTPAPAQPAAPARPTATATPPPDAVRMTVRSGDICLNVRAEASATAPTVACLDDGSAVAIVEGSVEADDRRWSRIFNLGWAAAEFLRPVEPEPAAPPAATAASAGRPMVVRSDDGCLNVRAAASTDAAVVDCLADGATITIVEGPVEAGGRRWSRIADRGWVATDFLRPDEAAPPATPAPAPPPMPPSGARPNRVVRLEEACVNVRERPSLEAPVVNCLPDGTRVAVVEGPVEADDYTWYRLDGLGWSVGTVLRPLED